MPKGFIIHPSYRVEGKEAKVYLIGRLENGESFLTINKFKPYFYIKESDLKKAKRLADVEFKQIDKKNFSEEKVVKVVLENPKDVRELRHKFNEQNIVCYEADIRFAYRFMIDNDLKGAVNIEGNAEKSDFVDRLFIDPKLTPENYFPELKVLSIDIETDRHAKKLYCVSLYGKGIKKVLMVKDKKIEGAETFKTQKEVLEEFKKEIKKYDPDILTGWNFIDFDLKVLREMFKKENIRFDLGKTDEEGSLRISDSFFIDSSAHFSGRVVLDGISMLKNSFIRLERYTLENASSVFLGEGKIFKGKDRIKEIEKNYKENPKLLAEYNLKDSKLALNVVKKSGALDLTITRSLISGMPLDRVSASIASLDSLYIRKAMKRNLVAPTTSSSERDKRIKGGYVMESKPGIYDNILILDFKSLYPSIIRTFGIDPYGFVSKEKAKRYKKSELVEAPNGAFFINREGILPSIIQELWEERDKAKKKKDKLSSHAVKILMNSFFGVLANPNCRFYSTDLGNAITYFGQHIIKTTAEKIREMKYDVIYGDTDSIFVDADVKNAKEAKEVGEKIQGIVNKFWDKHIKEDYNKKSFLDLEFEKVYKRFMMPRVRSSLEGAKKRYAGMLENGEIQFVGLEVVRRDWTDLAKKFQKELLEKVFAKEKIETFVENFVEKLKDGKYDELLVYKKSIRKDVREYTKTTPPHIQAARRIGRTSVGLIEYVQTLKGPEPIEKITGKYDYSHYVEKQLKPIADSILSFYEKDFDTILKGHNQKCLGDF